MKLSNISWLPAVVVMILIFSFSAKKADNSNESSMFLANQVLSVYENIADTEYDEAGQQIILEKINHYVRKTSHFCEYALLACTFVLHLLALKKRGKLLVILPVFLSVMYAATDEYHQTFVPGRSGQISDVLLDSSGAVTGTIIFVAIFSFLQYKKASIIRKQ